MWRRANKRALFHHLVGSDEQGRRYLKTERFSGLDIDGKLEFGW
jgi:hypothetical protein